MPWSSTSSFLSLPKVSNSDLPTNLHQIRSLLLDLFFIQDTMTVYPPLERSKVFAGSLPDQEQAPPTTRHSEHQIEGSGGAGGSIGLWQLPCSDWEGKVDCCGL
ncbi:hypothetical protein L218DRAFT_967032 [Marasmius fiardii PR-910]|nr:hypothetical protein L218DRAFT_967032 [Marasmius fiardii PR-910]